jgi:hypothetical protein
MAGRLPRAESPAGEYKVISPFMGMALPTGAEGQEWLLFCDKVDSCRVL